MCPWNIHDTAIRMKNGIVNVNGGVFFEPGDFSITVEKGGATLSGAVLLRRTKNDFIALSDATSVCAFGNLYVTTRYAFAKGAKISGTDLV